MKIRSEEERVAELEAKIAAIRSRGERRKARANPCVKLTVGAVKLLDKALNATDDATARQVLGDARGPLSAWLALNGLVVSSAVAEKPVKAAKRRRNNTAVSVG